MAISVENRKFSHPPAVFCAPAEEVALGIGYQSWGSKTIVRHIYGTTGPRNKFDIFSCVDTMHQRDGRTDGRTDTGRQQRPRLRIAWRGNQTCCQSLPTADRRHWKNKLMPAHPTSSFWNRYDIDILVPKISAILRSCHS